MLLNCDLGESYGNWSIGLDSEVMPHIDQANIACGFHAGDPDIMARLATETRQRGIALGAHPGFRDLHGFGDRFNKAAFSELLITIVERLDDPVSE